MLPTWMIVDKIELEMDGVRKLAMTAAGEEAEAAVADADETVRALGIDSDDQSILRAWRAVYRAEVAISNAARISHEVRPVATPRVPPPPER
jgi:hypothetical protein